MKTVDMSFFRRLFFVPRCAGCGARFNIFNNDGGELMSLCKTCRASWEREKLNSCSTCGVAAIDCVCAPKIIEKKYVDCIALVKFGRAAAVDRLIYTLKRRKIDRNFQFASSELAKRFLVYLRKHNIDPSDVVFTNVPRKISSIYRYGFDHAELLSRISAKMSGCEYDELLVRVSDGRDQKKLGADKRAENAKGRFELFDDRSLKGRIVVLVDDVVTTGNTANECVKLLRSKGASKIVLLSISRAPEKQIARRKSKR